MQIRPYEPGDAEGLWQRKRDFELGLGSDTGGDDKLGKYEEKLDATYRAEWLEWVERCVSEDDRCIIIAYDDFADSREDAVAGYAFMLPESHRFIWDAAVLNELFLSPGHRGTGVADDLMEAILEFARGQDLPLDRLVFDVDQENDRAKAFYDRYGFEHWGEMVARDL
jgi:GNAT superfamily N-acetyltransferase